MNQSKAKILCVDDDKDTRDLITFVLKQEGFEVTACSTAEECLENIKQENFEAIILDNILKKATSFELCRQIRSFNPTTPIVFLSGEARPAEIEKAISAGANAYLVKPMDFEKLTETVINLIAKGRAG